RPLSTRPPPSPGAARGGQGDLGNVQPLGGEGVKQAQALGQPPAVVFRARGVEKGLDVFRPAGAKEKAQEAAGVAQVVVLVLDSLFQQVLEIRGKEMSLGLFAQGGLRASPAFRWPAGPGSG